MRTNYGYRQAAATVPTGSLRITPTRRSLDNRFPQLGFTIQTGGKLYFEVLLTTDRALFAAQRAADRTPANFFPAHPEDRRLLPGVGGNAVFIVPQAVLHTFAAATPRPQAIYYTAIAYNDEAASQPIFAHPPETLSTDAPSVLLAADFRAETLSSILGIPISRLRRYQTGVTLAHQPAPSFMNDAAAGEDGYAAAALSDMPPSTPTGPQDGYEYYHTTSLPTSQSLSSDYDDGYNDWPGLFEDPALNQSQAVAVAHYSDDDLAHHQSYAMPQESRFPSGMPEPTALRDADEPWPSLDAADDASAFTYNDGFGDLPPVSDTYPVNGNGRSPIPAPLTADDVYADDEDEGVNDIADNGAPGNGTSRYGDEADDYAYEEAFAAAEVNDIFDPEIPYEPLSATALGGGSATTQPFAIEAQRAIIERIARFESGRDGFSAMNRDGEFRGLFGHDHDAYNRYHIGLSYGIVQFTQDSGNLGRLLTMMRDRDQARFNAIFGPDAEALIRVTTAAGPSSAHSADGRSARVQPIDGADLWEEPWVGRFTLAGRHIPFQAAQNELAAQLYITPILPFARWLGLTTDRALTIVVDRAVQMGVGGARAWIIRAVGPIQTAAQRQQALTALGHADLRSFQRATSGLTDDGDWGPQSHAAMIVALRGLGSVSPIEIPTREQMLAAMVRQSAGQHWGHRVQTFRDATDFSDTVYDF